MSLKNPVTTPGIDPGTVRLVAQLNVNRQVVVKEQHSKYLSLGPSCMN